MADNQITVAREMIGMVLEILSHLETFDPPEQSRILRWVRESLDLD